MKKVLVLFPNDWDRVELSREKYAEQYQFEFLGKDLFHFPQVWTLPFFDVDAFIRKAVNKVNQDAFDAVLSTDEYLGAILAAAVAQKTGLPGTEPEQIIRAQHKYYSRLAQSHHCPEASVLCQLIPQRLPKNFRYELNFPFFVKPVKGTFSLFAKKVDNQSALRKHLSFNWYERLALRVITRPYNQLLHKYSDLSENANHFIAEELIEGVQVTVDGYAFNGEVTICGIVDSVMFEGTNIFERFEYPSRLPESVRDRMVAVVKKLIQGLEFSNAQFNVELFYDATRDHLRVIEINPRLSYQFGDLYEHVDGVNTYQILLDLASGKKPEFEPGQGVFSQTASFVLRTFEGKELRSVPEADHLREFNDRYPESNVKIYGKKGTRLSKEMRAIGSYRYGIVNVGAHSLLDLFSIYEDVLDSLPFTYR